MCYSDVSWLDMVLMFENKAISSLNTVAIRLYIEASSGYKVQQSTKSISEIPSDLHTLHLGVAGRIYWSKRVACAPPVHGVLTHKKSKI